MYGNFMIAVGYIEVNKNCESSYFGNGLLDMGDRFLWN